MQPNSIGSSAGGKRSRTRKGKQGQWIDKRLNSAMLLPGTPVEMLYRRVEMAAKIIIDRKVKKGNVSEFLKLLEELRGKAISAKGYISGETLQASDDPHNLIVVSTWHSIEEWKNWEKNSERQEIQAKIEKLMVRPTKMKIYVNP
jgi:heme-degrading monooxygenase HmoA